MFNILHSYWLRTKRTPSRKILLICPLAFDFIFISYILTSQTLKGVEVICFFKIYTILVSFSISFFIPMLHASDKEASMYANDLRCGIDRKKLFFTKFLFIFILLIIIELIAVIPFWIFLNFYGVAIKTVEFVLYMAICSIPFMSMIPVYQFLSIKFNYSGSILSGSIFTLAAMLLGRTGLGENIWYFFPFVYPIRFMYGYASRLFTLNNLIIILFISFLISIVSLLIFSLWYNKWNGISKMEE